MNPDFVDALVPQIPAGLPAPAVIEVSPPKAKRRVPRSEPGALRFPDAALVGSCGELAKVLSERTEVPPEFVFAAALTLYGSLVGQGRLELAIGNRVEPRLFTVLLGESGDVKKSTAIKRAVEFFESLHLPVGMMFRTLNGVASAEGLVRQLGDWPCVVLVYDEFRAFLDKCKIQGSALLGAVASLFEGGDWDNATKNARHSVSVRGAKLSLLAACTTETWEGVWGSDAISIGLPNRLFVIYAEAQPRVAWPESPDPAMEVKLRDRIEKQLKRLPMKFAITPDAKQMWEDWYEALPGTQHAKRLDTIGFRLMLLLALSMDKSEVDAEVIRVVIEILNYELNVRMMNDPVDADGTVARLEEKIRRAIASYGTLSHRDLRRKVSADRAGLWAFKSALANLTAAGDIAVTGSFVGSVTSADPSAPPKTDLTPI